MNKKASTAGFSLVEVAIALAVASFCLITISGLLSVGLTSSQTSSKESIMANIATQVANDLQATPSTPGAENQPSATSKFYGITIPGPSGTTSMSAPVGSSTGASATAPIYVLASGATTDTAGNSVTSANADYCVWVGFRPPAAGFGATTVRILITWPAQAAPNVDANGWPTTFSGSYETMLSLNRN